MKVAFIGLGIMGSRMAKNLLKNDVELTIYNRSEAPAKALETQGATRAMSVAEAVKNADVVFTMLATPQVVEELMLGSEGGLHHAKEGAIWADCSTVDPSFSIKCHQFAQNQNIHFLDAPVSGTKPHAENAQLTYFIGGEAEILEQIKPLLEHMSQKVMHIGAAGKGSSFKVLVNALLAQSMLMFSETVLLGEKMGLDKEFLLNTLPNLPVCAPVTKFKVDMIKSKDYEVNFPLELMHKDLHLVGLAAYENNQPLYLANMAKEVFAEAKKSGLGRLDFAAIYKYLEER